MPTPFRNHKGGDAAINPAIADAGFTHNFPIFAFCAFFLVERMGCGIDWQLAFFRDVNLVAFIAVIKGDRDPKYPLPGNHPVPFEPSRPILEKLERMRRPPNHGFRGLDNFRLVLPYPDEPLP